MARWVCEEEIGVCENSAFSLGVQEKTGPPCTEVFSAAFITWVGGLDDLQGPSDSESL